MKNTQNIDNTHRPAISNIYNSNNRTQETRTQEAKYMLFNHKTEVQVKGLLIAWCMQKNLINPQKKDMNYDVFGSNLIERSIQFITPTIEHELRDALLKVLEERTDLSSIMLICKKYENKNLLSCIMRLSIAHDIFINWGIEDKKLIEFLLYDVVSGKLEFSLEESLSNKNYPQFLRRVATSNDSDRFLVIMFKQLLLASSSLNFSVKEKNKDNYDVLHYLLKNQNGHDKMKVLLEFVRPEQYIDVYSFIKTVIMSVNILKDVTGAELNLGLFAYYAEPEDWHTLRNILSTYNLEPKENKLLLEQLYEFVNQKDSRKYILPVFGLKKQDN